MSTPPDRRYNEEEIRAVLGRAIARQEAARHPEPYDDGLTLDELRRIAAEVGVEPRFVEAAAAELDRPAAPEASKAHPLLGGPLHVRAERVVQNELTEADVAPLLEALRAGLKTQQGGRIETLAGSVAWIAKDKNIGNPIRFHALPEAGRTRLTLDHRLESSATLWHIWPMMLVFFSLAPLLAPDGSALAALMMFAVALGLHGIARFGFKRHAHRRARQVEDLMDRVEALATRAAAPPATLAAASDEPRAASARLGAKDEFAAEDAPADAHRTAPRQKTR